MAASREWAQRCLSSRDGKERLKEEMAEGLRRRVVPVTSRIEGEEGAWVCLGGQEMQLSGVKRIYAKGEGGYMAGRSGHGHHHNHGHNQVIIQEK